VIEGVKRLSTHPMLDRLIRGRSWIAIVAFALIGIVTLQLGLLKLNAGIGHSLRLEANLQRENAALSIENSELAAGDVVESRAGRLGMEVVPAGALRFLTAHPGADMGHGAAALKTPLAGAQAAASTTEASSASAAEAAKSTAGGEASTHAGESTTSSESGGSSESTTSSTSESPEAKGPAGESSESSASRAGAEPAGEERAAERSSSAAAAAPSAGGSNEPSGGTQAGSTGR
jgi:hypothetical protein